MWYNVYVGVLERVRVGCEMGCITPPHSYPLDGDLYESPTPISIGQDPRQMSRSRSKKYARIQRQSDNAPILQCPHVLNFGKFPDLS